MIALQQCRVALSDTFSFFTEQFVVQPLQHVALVGANGSGKSALAAVLAGKGEVVEGERLVSVSTGWVSSAQHQALIAEEKKKDDADILDVVPVPSTTTEVVLKQCGKLGAEQQAFFDKLTAGLRMNHFLDNAFLGLSTGETRKALLVKTLLEAPQLLILDEPWDGLDSASSAFLRELLDELSGKMTIVIIVNRLSEIPSFINQLVLMQDCKVVWASQGDVVSNDDREQIKHLLHLENVPTSLPPKDADRASPQMKDDETTLVALKDGEVSYDGRIIFSGLNWQVNKSEHWQVVGPNGSGKTCLLSMITGDDSHCYTNDLTVFGYKRGSGESIWDIKQHIGLVSNTFHLQYRVTSSVLHVVLSGFFDSIGLYEQPTVKQKQLAREWIALAGMTDRLNTSFQSLSFGDQRLLLIVRAMVKHPTLLILDEPCNGLDEINRLKVLALLGIIAKGGESTLLYVNHHSEDRIDGIGQVLNMQDYN